MFEAKYSDTRYIKPQTQKPNDKNNNNNSSILSKGIDVIQQGAAVPILMVFAIVK